MRIALMLALLPAGVLSHARESLPQDSRLPVPDAASQEKAEKLIRDVFKGEFAKTSPDNRKALVSKLRAQAKTSDVQPNVQYVLYREAKKQALLARDFDLALEIVAEWSTRFEIDAFSMRLDILKTLRLKARTVEKKKELAKVYLEMVDEAARAGQFEVARKALTYAVSLARSAKDMPLVTQAKLKEKEVANLKKRFAELKKLKETLESNPEDPSANTSWGEHLCREKGDWERGLPHLAKGVDGPLKEAARKDLAI